MTYEGLHNPNPPTPVLANYLWVGFFPVAYVGVMLLMRQEVRKFTRGQLSGRRGGHADVRRPRSPRSPSAAIQTLRSATTRSPWPGT